MKNRAFPKLLIFLLIMTVVFSHYAEAGMVDDVTATLEIYIADASVLFLNDLNLANLESTPLLFAVTITNNTNQLKTVIMHFGINKGSDILIDGTSKPFEMAPNEIIHLTNQNIFTSGQKYSLQNVDIGGAAEELKNAILSSGKLPSGNYKFFVEIYDENNNQEFLDEASKEIFITDPTILDLNSPGQPAEDYDLMEVYTTYPFFQWQSNANEFEITVCEKLPTNSSPSDVMNNEPRLKQTTNTTFFQYPSAGAWPLEEGKTYYWQVIASIQSSSGPIKLESEIWGFKVGNISGGTFSVENEQMLSMLKTLFPDGGIEALFEKGGSLEGFTFTGVMMNNGKTLSMDDLNAFFQKVMNKEITIDNFIVE